MDSRKQVILIILILFILPSALAKIEITEIMFDPEGSDSGREWIEIYSEKPINISGWKFYEDNVNHGLKLEQGNWTIDGYAIIADKSETFLNEYPHFNGTLFDSSWSSLSNSGEYLALRNNLKEIVEEINYSKEWGSQGTSLERINLQKNNTRENWGSSLFLKGTPGRENSLFGSCDWEISIIPDKEIWKMENDTAVVQWKIEVKENSNQKGINLSYWIEDSFGNIVKSKIEKNANTSSTFGKYRKTFHSGGGYLLLANITSKSCRDINPSNDFAMKPLVIFGENQNDKTIESSIKIVDISPSSAPFGNIIKVKTDIYRGDTAKYAVYFYVQDSKRRKVSEKSTTHIRKKFTEYGLTVPVILKNSCSLKSGDYELVIEGLGLKETEKIYLEEKECKKNKVEKEKSNDEKNKLFFRIIDLPSSINGGEELKIKVETQNENKEHQFRIWSYLYRGSKCYSCGTLSKEDNAQKFNLDENEINVVEFILNPDNNLKGGEYKVKVKINKDNQKTNQELTETVFIQQKLSSSEPANSLVEEVNLKSKKSLDSQGIVVYESNAIKAKKLIPYVLLVTFGLLSIVLLKK